MGPCVQMYSCMYVKYAHSNILGMMVKNTMYVLSMMASPMASMVLQAAHSVMFFSW